MKRFFVPHWKIYSQTILLTISLSWIKVIYPWWIVTYCWRQWGQNDATYYDDHCSQAGVCLDHYRFTITFIRSMCIHLVKVLCLWVNVAQFMLIQSLGVDVHMLLEVEKFDLNMDYLVVLMMLQPSYPELHWWWYKASIISIIN